MFVIAESVKHGEAYSSRESGEGPWQDRVSGAMHASKSGVPERAESTTHQEREGSGTRRGYPDAVGVRARSQETPLERRCASNRAHF